MRTAATGQTSLGPGHHRARGRSVKQPPPFVEALKLTKQPTRQALMDAVHQLKSQQIPLLLRGVSIDGSSRNAPPLKGVVVQQLRGGKWNTVS